MCFQQTETERKTLAQAFQAGTVYFCWKHNCLWPGFGDRFCPPNRQDGRVLALCRDCPLWWPDKLARDPRRRYLEGGRCFSSGGSVNTAQMCLAVMRSDIIHEDTTESVIAYRAGRDRKFWVQKPTDLWRITDMGIKLMWLFLWTSVHPERDSRALSSVWEKVISEQMLCGILDTWCGANYHTQQLGVGTTKTTQKLKHNKRKVCF